MDRYIQSCINEVEKIKQEKTLNDTEINQKKLHDMEDKLIKCINDRIKLFMNQVY